MNATRRIAVGTFLVAIACSRVALCGSDILSAVAQLLGAGEKNNPTAIAAGRAEYDHLRKSHPKDIRIDYAYAVVLANQHRYQDAAPLVSRYREATPDDLPASRLGIWLLIQSKQYQKALDEAKTLSQRLPKGKPRHLDAEHVATARFLGAVFGYVELARPGIVDAKDTLACKNQILARIAEGYLAEFDRGRDAVAKQVDELEAQRDAQRKLAAASAERAKDLAKSALDENKKAIANQQDAMQSSQAQLVEAERELTVLRNQLHTLQHDRSRLTAQIITAQTYYNSLVTTQTTARVNDRTVPGSPFPVQETVVETQGISPGRFAAASAAAMRLALFNKQAFELDRRILALQSRAAELGGARDKERLVLDESQAAVRQAERRAKGSELRLRRTSPTSTARATALAAKMASFSTYVPFDYDAETKRVLSWFEK